MHETGSGRSSFDHQAWSTSNPYAEMSSVRSNSNPVVAYPDVYVAQNTSADQTDPATATTTNIPSVPSLWQQPSPPKYNEIVLKPEMTQKPEDDPNPNSNSEGNETSHSVPDLIHLPSYESLKKE